MTFDLRIKKIIEQQKKILFVGIGSALLSDDGIGIYICKNIVEKENFKTLVVENSIEKYVGKINSIAPEILILIDCTDFGEQPGYYDLISVSDVKDTTVNTHTISLRRISEFFIMDTFLLGIQPKTVKYGEQFSNEVHNAAIEIIDKINNFINFL